LSLPEKCWRSSAEIFSLGGCDSLESKWTFDTHPIVARLVIEDSCNLRYEADIFSMLVICTTSFVWFPTSVLFCSDMLRCVAPSLLFFSCLHPICQTFPSILSQQINVEFCET
jgi:hypothetical protein